MLKAWRVEWFSGKPEAPNLLEMPGAASAMKGTLTAELQSQKGEDFDLRFVDMMATHDQGVIMLAQDALLKSRRREVRDFARGVIDDRTADVDSLNQWVSRWAAAGQ